MSYVNDIIRVMKRSFHLMTGLILVITSVVPCVLCASESNRETVFLNADATSFWRTATNNVIALPVDMPVLATSAKLTVQGAGYRREYAIDRSGDYEIVLPSADTLQKENVYELTLSFNEGTERKARIGLVQSYSSVGGAGAATRVLAPKGDRKWNVVKKMAVVPIPYGTTLLSVNGTEIEDAAANAQGWYALAAASGATVSLSLQENDVSRDVSLSVYGPGHFVIIR